MFGFGTFVEDHSATYTRVYFCTLYFVPLVYFVPSVFILVSHCFDYFVIFKSGGVMLPSLFFSPKIALVIQGPLRLYMNLRLLFPVFAKNGIGVLIVTVLNL